MEDHLDMHFRQNRKANQSLGRGHSRSWFVDLDVRIFFLLDPKHANRLSQDWVHEGRVDVKGKGRADGPRPTTNKAALAVDAARRDAELRTQFVVVPSGDEAKSLSCPICKETLKTEFLEDDEEWVWKNAVRKDDKVRIGSSMMSIFITYWPRYITQHVMLKLWVRCILWLQDYAKIQPVGAGLARQMLLELLPKRATQVYGLPSLGHPTLNALHSSARRVSMITVNPLSKWRVMEHRL